MANLQHVILQRAINGHGCCALDGSGSEVGRSLSVMFRIIGNDTTEANLDPKSA